VGALNKTARIYAAKGKKEKKSNEARVIYSTE
jgi:hypothetical protein